MPSAADKVSEVKVERRDAKLFTALEDAHARGEIAERTLQRLLGDLSMLAQCNMCEKHP
jgi:hypothetical protein